MIMSKRNNNLSDLTSKIIAYEQDELSLDETVELFQELYNTGMIYGFQGHYQRTFNVLLAEGLVTTSHT